MRRRLILASLTVLVAGCAGDDGSDRSDAEPNASGSEQSRHAADQPQNAKDFVGPWRVRAHVEPREIRPLVFSVASLRSSRSYEGPGRAPFIRGELGFRNTGDAPVFLKQIDYSAFSEDELAGNQLLLAEGQCGYGTTHPGGPAKPSFCTLALLGPTRIAPTATEEHPFTLFKGLRGMAPLEPGRYKFTRRVKFTVGESAEEAKHAARSTIVMEFRRTRGPD